MSEPHDPVPYLSSLLRDPDDQTRQMIGDRDQVHREYGRLFHPDRLDRLTAEDLKAFLLYENNRHWWGIHRHQAKLVADMDLLRRELRMMLDESQPITKRLDRMEPGDASKPLPGLGNAVFTPILHVVYPDKYGVWNSISESAMTRLGLWPRFGGSSFGHQYVAMNDAIKSVATQLGTDLWTVDALWWRVERDHQPHQALLRRRGFDLTEFQPDRDQDRPIEGIGPDEELDAFEPPARQVGGPPRRI